MIARTLICFFLFSSLLFSATKTNVQHQVTAIVSKDSTTFYKNYFPKHSVKEEIIKHSAYTLCYDEKYEQAKWVAYYLTAEMCNNKNEKRKNNFREDPEVKTKSASLEDYKKSGYDRGHLCPAGDMAWSELTMSESFYMSNMSPQVPAFNRGIWKYLESDVREWAKQNKELYIVTAGVLKDSLPTIGANKVAVPHYFYKIILDYCKPEYKAIAFVIANEGSKQSVFDFAVSIDSVEKLTGLDFFPTLSDSIEENLESHIDIEKWK